jgi:peptidoglycan/LPS O-acetylase OafA/YrhL
MASPDRVNAALGADSGDFTLNESMSVSLDGIRALSAQAVVVGHAISFFGVLKQLQPPFAPYMQNVGVVVFFVLSGFLIAYTVRRKRAFGRYTFGTYAVERFARIFSGFVPGLAFIAAIDTAVVLWGSSRYAYSGAYSVGMLGANIAMLQDHDFAVFISRFVPGMLEPSVAGVTAFGSGRPLWTLAIEWWIYMAFGWLVLAGAVRSRHPIRFVAIAVVFAAIPVFNLVGGRGHSLTMMWIMGALTFWVMVTVPPRWSARTSGDEYDLVFACLLAGAAYFLLSTFRVSSFRYPAPLARVARFVAGYSLTLYVTHYTILATMVAVDAPLPKPVLVVLAFVLCNAVAAAIAWPTEMRHKRFAAWLLARMRGAADPGLHQYQPALEPVVIEPGRPES